MNIRIEPMKHSQLETVAALLDDSKLPSEDVEEHWQNFLVAFNGGQLVGAVGLEFYNTDGFVRSFVVAPSLRNNGLGKRLYDAAVSYARSKSVARLGLLTNTAEKFFAREGFQKIERERMPEFIKQTKEFTTFCPSSAVVMVKNLS
jgi:amino-acid N-acetyltransferase